jgi:hypothetical protein
MAHCSIVTVGCLDHTYWRVPPATATAAEEEQTWPPKFLRAAAGCVDEDWIASNRNILLLSKNEIKTIISPPKVWCCEKNSPWEFKL